MKKLFACLFLLAAAALAVAQPPDRQADLPPLIGGPRVSWYATWEQGAAAARRANRPILLIAAAPQCHGVSGLW